MKLLDISEAQLAKVRWAVYGLALTGAVALWLIAIRAPLWLDETGSYWYISRGFSQIWQTQSYVTDPAGYYSILWCFTKVLGTSETALRIPSFLAMLGAAYLLYLCARELFNRESSWIAVLVFCLHPIVVFEAVDVRAYAFAILVCNAAILVLLRLRKSDSSWMAALFGFLAAALLNFHYLFGTILPALLLLFFVFKFRDKKTMWRQAAIALGVFSLGVLPLVPGVRHMFATGKTHVFEQAPEFADITWTLLPTLIVVAFLVAVVFTVTLMKARPGQKERQNAAELDKSRILICGVLALFPLLLLFAVSEWTSLHIFAMRHRLDAVPGIALCWALITERYINRSAPRLLFCLLATGLTVYSATHSEYYRNHFVSWKYALAAVEKTASVDNAPVLVCSGFPEADYMSVANRNAKEDHLYTQLSYYRLSVPVVPMPRGLNDEAVKIGTEFIKKAERNHQRFFAMGFYWSYPALDWLRQSASDSFSSHELGNYQGIKVIEFDPLDNEKSRSN